jgi:N-acetylmuramoyl-L-alanine amidase
MVFKIKYTIEKKYLPVKSLRRSGKKIDKVLFVVAHDTGNDGSTAENNVNYYINSANQIEASAHIFVDDKKIIECIPALTGEPEKAWHVLYNKPIDNKMFGDDANDVAIGVELCYSHKKGSIKNEEAYKRYVWVLAYICYKFGLNPRKHIVGHHMLDPERKTDPVNALSKMGKTFEQLINDVEKEYQSCIEDDKKATTQKQVEVQMASNTSPKLYGVATGDVWLHSKPDFKEETRTKVLKKGEKVEILGETTNMYKTNKGYVSKKYILRRKG